MQICNYNRFQRNYWHEIRVVAKLPPMGRAIQAGERVCVTGAAGYIGTHVVDQLLKAGYRVRGTVRDTSATDKNRHLHALAEACDGELELVSADLTEPGAFDDAVADCPYVCHVASSVRLTAPDPQKQIVDVAVDGTNNVLASIDRAGCARRVVVTSSIAAVVDEEKPTDHIFDEDDWNDSATLQEQPYPLSKTLAERAAWDHVKGHGEAKYDLVTINPTLVLGPLLSKAHARSSPAILKDLLTGKFPAIPDFRFGIVDVRDVALAHVRALEREAAGGRHILNNHNAALTEIAGLLRSRFPDRKTPKLKMPNALMYGIALFDKRLTWGFLRRSLSIVRRIDSNKSKRDLGIDYRPIETTVHDTGQSFIGLNLA